MNLIIDASNIIHRSFWIANKTGGDEQEVGSLQAYIFLRTLKSYFDKFKPDNVYCVWDKKLEPETLCFRKVVAAETYKTNRDAERTEKVYQHYSVIEEYIDALGCYNVFPFAMEGDDVIAYLTRRLEAPMIIVSADKDLLQLVNNKVSFYDVNKKCIINMDNFKNYTEVLPEDFVQYKCLIGDPADNIARIAAPAKAKKILLKTVVLNEEQKLQLEQNFILTDLHNSYDRQQGELDKMNAQFDNLKTAGTFKKFLELCKKHQMNNIIDKQQEWLQTFYTHKSLHNIVNMFK